MHAIIIQLCIIKKCMVLDGGWLAIVKVSTYTPVLHLLGWGHIASLTHQVLYDCHIHKKLFNLLDF